ncbi:hypothetical protein [Parafrigoribacterium mesophilum]
MSGWGAGYPGVPSDVAQKARAQAAAEETQQHVEDSADDAAEEQSK